MAEAKSGIQTGIRHTDDDVGIHRMRLCKNTTGLDPGPVNGNAVNDRIRSCKINVFKNTEFLFFLLAVFPSGHYSILRKYKDLSRFHIPDKIRAYGL